MINSSNYAIINAIFPYLPKNARDICYHRFLFNADFPEIVHIENTNACNAQCIMCPREKMIRPIGFMDFDLFKKIVEECAASRQFRTMHLHGYGECLIEKNFHHKINYAKERGVKETYIVSNGSLLSEQVAELLIRAGLDKIKISLYGASKETYEKVHVNLKFKDVEDNVRTLFHVRKSLKMRNPSVLLQFLPVQENMHERDLFKQKWGQLIDPSKGDALLEFRLHNYGFGRKYHVVKSENKRRPCPLPFVTMQILWNGDVVPCCYDFNGDLILGNVRKETVESVWNSANFGILRNAHRRLNFKSVDFCRQCDQILAADS